MKWTMIATLVLATGCDDGMEPADDMSAADGGVVADAMTPDEGMPPDEGTPPDGGLEAPLTAADLLGTWTSAVCEAYPNGDGTTTWLDRQFRFTDSRWHLYGTVFGDAACTVPVFSFDIDGPYEITGGSALGPDVAEAQFRFESNLWTAWLPDFAETLSGAGCGDGMWAVGVPQDVNEGGCIGVAHPAAECADGELDLLRLEGETLYLGERSVDLCAQRAPAVGAYGLQRQVDVVEIDVERFYPEGVAMDADRTLYVSSFAAGGVRRAALGEGTAAAFVDAAALGSPAAGMTAREGRLWVCLTDLVDPTRSALVQLDAVTGDEQGRFPIPGGGICNDLTIDEAGVAYVTESSRNEILRLPPGADALEPWFDGAALDPVGAIGFGLNGLVIDGDGSLLVGRSDDGTLVRVPITADGSAGEPSVEPVEPAAQMGVDGMQRWRGTIYAVRGGMLVRLVPAGDGWRSEVIDDTLDFPTTLHIDRSGNAWVVESKFGLLFDGDDQTDAEAPFRLVRVDLH